MKILTRSQFTHQVTSQRDYYSVNSYNGNPAPYNVNVAWYMYENAANAVNKLLVFGRTNIERPEAQRLPGAIEEIDLWNFGATNNDMGTRDDYIPAAIQGGGGILRYKTVTGNCLWHELYNHAWLLGGVHGRAEFHSASPRTRGMILSGNGPSMWGHELLFLDYFGYFPRKRFGLEVWTPLVSPGYKTLGDFIQYFATVSNNPAEIYRRVGDPAAQPTPASQQDRLNWAKTVRA